MGYTGIRRSAGIAGHLAAALLLTSLACGGDSAGVSELLLGTGDFASPEINRTGFESGKTALGHQTAIAELAGPGFVLQHSLVIFNDEASAHTALAGVKLQWEHQARDSDTSTLIRDHLPILSNLAQGLVAGLLEEVRAGNSTSSLIFVEGRVLVRLTMTGPSGRELLATYAEKARLKASRN